MFDINVKTNLPDFKRQLAAFGADFERRAVRSGVAAAATAFKKIAIRLAPVLKLSNERKGRVSGLLKRAIYTKKGRSGKGVIRYFVSFRKGRKAAAKGSDAYYGKFLEYGWVPRGPGKALRGGRRTKALLRSRSAHEKITKYRFINPAYQQGQALAVAAFTKRIEARLAQENRKL